MWDVVYWKCLYNKQAAVHLHGLSYASGFVTLISAETVNLGPPASHTTWHRPVGTMRRPAEVTRERPAGPSEKESAASPPGARSSTRSKAKSCLRGGRGTSADGCRTA